MVRQLKECETGVKDDDETGFINLKSKAEELSNFINDVYFTQPSADKKVKQQLMRTTQSLCDLLEVLEFYN